MRNKQLQGTQALDILTNLVKQFPGLVLVDEEVNGADLVEAITQSINENDNALLEYLTDALN